MELILNEPVRLPRAGGQDVWAVFWVRIYRDAHSAVVIVADVPANPGPSPGNADTKIATQLTRDYSLEDLNVRWFFCHPGRFPPDDPWSRTKYHEAGFTGPEMTRTWPGGSEEIPRAEISAAIGKPLDLMPKHEEVLERVLAAGGRLQRPVRPMRLIILPGGSIPPPLWLFRCEHAERYERFLRDRGYDPGAVVGIPVNVREEYFSQLTEADYQACPYHQSDWRAIAAEAVRLIRAMGEYPVSWKLAGAIEATRLSDREKNGLFSLLQDPIRWEHDFVWEGKHRSCALRQCGAPEIVRGAYGPAGHAYTWRMGDDA